MKRSCADSSSADGGSGRCDGLREIGAGFGGGAAAGLAAAAFAATGGSFFGDERAASADGFGFGGDGFTAGRDAGFGGAGFGSVRFGGESPFSGVGLARDRDSESDDVDALFFGDSVFIDACECECIIFTWCCHAATFASPMVGVRSATPLNAAPMPGPRYAWVNGTTRWPPKDMRRKSEERK